eukprot:7214805-Pyramimonas_sp.AAC.1
MTTLPCGGGRRQAPQACRLSCWLNRNLERPPCVLTSPAGQAPVSPAALQSRHPTSSALPFDLMETHVLPSPSSSLNSAQPVCRGAKGG